MAYSQPLTDFAQSIYLATRNRYYDDIASADGQTYISQVVDWTNQFLDELETTVDDNGQPVLWNWLKQKDYELETVNTGDTDISLDSEVLHIVTSSSRPVKIFLNDRVMSEWPIVSPSQIREYWKPGGGDLIARFGDSLFLSREITETENGGTMVCDVVTAIPRLISGNERALSIVKPKQLLILGVAKNSTLPDIVQGGLSPTYLQKYNDLLQSAILFNNNTSSSDFIVKEDYGYIGGVGF